MNGSTFPIPQLQVANPCVQLLENMLADAKIGKLTSVAVVAITPQSGIVNAYAGGQRGDLLVGTLLLQDRIKDDIKGPQTRSPLVRAGLIG